MASRVSYAGTALAGDVYLAANHAKMPGGWIGYAEVTAAQAGIDTTETDLTGLAVTVTVNDDRRIKVTGHALAGASGGAVIAVGRIKEGAAELGRWMHASISSDATFHAEEGSVILTPSAGSHTYKLTMQDGGIAAGTVTLQASAVVPAFILVEDLGPAS